MRRKVVPMLLIFTLSGLLLACGAAPASNEGAAPTEGAREPAVEAPASTATESEPAPQAEPTSRSTPTPEPTAPPSPTPEPTATPEPAPAEAVGPVKIAFLGALELDWQQEQLNWARLAIEDFNTETGWNVELVDVDVGTNPATVMAAIDPVAGDGAVYAALGPPFVTQIAAASTIFDAAGLPHIVFNGYPGFTGGGQILFRMVPTDDLQGPAAARFIVGTLGAKKVFVIVQQGQGNPGTYGYELYTAFEQALAGAGGTIIGREAIASDATDFSALIASLEASGAEAVFGADLAAEQGAQIAQALREAGLDTPLVGHAGWADAPFAAAAEGAYALSPAPAVTDPALAQRYTGQHGSFGVEGPLAYAATMVAVEAIQRAAEAGNLTPQAVRDEIANTNQASSILGRPIAFDAGGNLKEAQFYLLQVENGVFKMVGP